MAKYYVYMEGHKHILGLFALRASSDYIYSTAISYIQTQKENTACM